MNGAEVNDLWTWRLAEHPRVEQLFSSTLPTPSWPDDLENLAGDPITGKVMSTVAGLEIARNVVERTCLPSDRRQEALHQLDLCAAWVDDPTSEKFEAIEHFLFGKPHEWITPSDPLRVAWSALRVATSSVGNFEAGWALGMVVEDADEAGLNAAEIAWNALRLRIA